MNAGDHHETDRPLVLTIGLSTILGIGKLAGALLTGSQAVFASAADSIGDVAVSAANLWLLRRAREPADADHPYGHGKIEGLAGLGQGLFLCGVIAGVAVRAGLALMAPATHPVLAGPALGVMVVSLGISTGISVMLERAAKRTGSLVLQADAVHYRMDRWTGLATIVGLVGTLALHEPRVDAVAALAVCAIMARDVSGLLRGAIDELMDHALTDDEMQRIRSILDTPRPLLVGWHDLRARRAGPRRFVEVHLEFPKDTALVHVHEVAESVENDLRAVLTGAEVIVHMDPA